MISSKVVKKRIIQYGADICGVAPVTRFVDAPKGFHPCDIYPDCRSVIVFAARFPLSTLQARTNAPYTLVRNEMVEKVDWISFHVSSELETKGVVSVPVPSADPYDYWDTDRNHGRGILSLKHAGVLAGLGVLGKNTLLLNERFGNMIWLGAILVSTDLRPDPIASYEGCMPECTLCIDSCPQHALDGVTIDQKLCRERSISYTKAGGSILSCNICRKVCPYHEGLLRKQKAESREKGVGKRLVTGLFLFVWLFYSLGCKLISGNWILSDETHGRNVMPSPLRQAVQDLNLRYSEPLKK